MNEEQHAVRLCPRVSFLSEAVAAKYVFDGVKRNISGENATLYVGRGNDAGLLPETRVVASNPFLARPHPIEQPRIMQSVACVNFRTCKKVDGTSVHYFNVRRKDGRKFFGFWLQNP